MVAHLGAIKIQLGEAQTAVGYGCPADLARNREFLPQQARGQAVLGDETGRTPRSHSVVAELLGTGPGGVQESGALPAGFRLGGDVPVAAGLDQQRLSGGKVHLYRTNQAGTARAAMYGPNGDGVFAHVKEGNEVLHPCGKVALEFAATSSPLTNTWAWLSAATTQMARMTQRFAGTVKVSRKKRSPSGAAACALGVSQIQRAPSSVRYGLPGSFTTPASSRPIHFPCQSSGLKSPMLH